jgi:hypothetical protein
MGLQLLLLLLLQQPAQADADMAPPPKQTPSQLKSMARFRAQARAASAAAAPGAVQLLSTAAFRANLSAVAPGLAGLPAEELLARWRAAMAVAEVALAMAPWAVYRESFRRRLVIY